MEDPCINILPEEEPRTLIPDPTLVSYSIMPKNENGKIEVALNLWGNKITEIESDFLDHLVDTLEQFLEELESVQFERDIEEGNYA